eukprot:8441458-Karenia_brevis.AAC.1
MSAKRQVLRQNIGLSHESSGVTAAYAALTGSRHFQHAIDSIIHRAMFQSVPFVHILSYASP